jgi:hypothetical protein
VKRPYRLTGAKMQMQIYLPRRQELRHSDDLSPGRRDMYSSRISDDLYDTLLELQNTKSVSVFQFDLEMQYVLSKDCLTRIQRVPLGYPLVLSSILSISDPDPSLYSC